jgi:outer membrane protein assembly factor BamB
VISGGQVWVTTAREVEASEEEAERRKQSNTGGQPLTVLEEATFYALCIDLSSGELLHEIELFKVEKPQWVHRFNSYASPSPVIESGRLYCHFGTFGTACVDTKTAKVLWTNQELNCMHENGPGGSPVLSGDRLIFHMDGSDVQYIAALDKATGKLAWKTGRSGEMHENPQLKKAYGTPLLVGGEVLSPAANWLYAYDPKDGKENWKLSYETLGFSNVARPVVGDGMIFLSTCFMRPQMLGIRLGKEPEIVWRHEKAVPSSPSPLYVDGLLYFIGDSGGLASCVEAETGDVVWSERISSGKYWAAPLHAGGKIYFHSEEGVTTVIDAGPEFKVLAENTLDGKLMASAAVANDDLILRTDKALYRIGDGK